MFDHSQNHLIEVKVWGRYACFTRPENKVERVSYPIITPSAAVGILESIYWKPEFRWEVTGLGLLPHPDRGGHIDWENYMSMTLNELASQGETHPRDGYNIKQHRVQRTCQILRWPCYAIRARARIFASSTNPASIARQFNHRVRQGQCYHQPYLGLRELGAFFGVLDTDPVSTLDFSNLGYIVHSAVLPEGATEVQYRFCKLVQGNGWLRPVMEETFR
ncbi:MAG: type I-C CRISPR-associated protein Cas5 [Armatimonadetes bacterium]|nr:type I-C CRISPR-associated protein Cas5 [Armatimonadota bacterium]